MNLGRPISLLIIILIAFGYIMSDDQSVRRDLKEVRVQLDNVNAQIVDANNNLAACVSTVQTDQQTISQLKTENATLNNAVSGKENEINALKSMVSQEANRIAQLEGSLANSPSEVTTLQTAQPVTPWQQLNPIIWGVALTAQLVLVVVQRNQKKGYVRLSPEERAYIIRLRRMKKSK